MPIKKLYVHSADWEKYIDIDSDIFDDVFIEACTRVLDDNLKNKNMSVAPFMESRLKRGKTTYIFNTYKILINAGYYRYAENLRIHFKRQSKIDLRDEPIKG